MRKTLLLLLLLSLSLAHPVHAASREQKNRCNDAVSELRGAPSFVYQREDIDLKTVENATAHLNQHMDRYNRAQKMLDSTGSWDAKDADLAECVELLQRSRAYIEATKAKILAAQTLGIKQAPVLAAAKGRDAENALFLLVRVHVSENERGFGNMTPVQAKALVETLAPVEAACKQAMPDAAKTPPALGGGEMRTGDVVLPANLADRADWWCWIAAHRMELATKALGNVSVMAKSYGNYHREFPEILKAGKSWGGGLELWVLDVVRDEKPFMTELRVALGDWYKAFGLTMPEPPFPGLPEQISQIRAAVTAAVARNRLEPGNDHDKGLEAGARRAVTKLGPKVSAVASWMYSSTWTIDQNRFGIPTGRYRTGTVVYRVGSDPWCVRRTFNYNEPHIGGGKYQADPAPHLAGAGVVKCP